MPGDSHYPNCDNLLDAYEEIAAAFNSLDTKHSTQRNEHIAIFEIGQIFQQKKSRQHSAEELNSLIEKLEAIAIQTNDTHLIADKKSLVNLLKSFGKILQQEHHRLAPIEELRSLMVLPRYNLLPKSGGCEQMPKESASPRPPTPKDVTAPEYYADFYPTPMSEESSTPPSLNKTPLGEIQKLDVTSPVYTAELFATHTLKTPAFNQKPLGNPRNGRHASHDAENQRSSLLIPEASNQNQATPFSNKPLGNGNQTFFKAQSTTALVSSKSHGATPLRVN